MAKTSLIAQFLDKSETLKLQTSEIITRKGLPSQKHPRGTPPYTNIMPLQLLSLCQAHTTPSHTKGDE